MLYRSALLAIVLSVTGCTLKPSQVLVYIDNSGHEPMTITVDGEEEMTIEAGEVAELTFEPGEHQFLLTTDSGTVCDLARNLEPSDKFGVARKYLFDPLKNHRYQRYAAEYGEIALGDLVEMTVFNAQQDEAAQRLYIYKQLLKEIELVPSDAWNDVTGVHYVLEAPPENVYTRGTAKRQVLDRIDPTTYDRLSEAKQIENPTDDDLDKLSELVDQALAQSL
jgi:hypothetical protein